MIREVSFDKTTYNDIPYKFEAGTPAIASAIALSVALQYLQDIGFEKIMAHEQSLLRYAVEQLQSIPNVNIIGNAQEKVGVISFTMKGVHPHDIGSIVDQYGVAIRAGHHCAMPVMTFFEIAATARASFGIYNTTDDVDRLTNALREVNKLFRIIS